MSDSITVKEIVKVIDTLRAEPAPSPAQLLYGDSPSPTIIPTWSRSTEYHMGRAVAFVATRPLGGRSTWLASQLGVGLIRCANAREGLLPGHYPDRGYMVDVECGLEFNGTEHIAGYHVERWFPTRRRAFEAFRFWLACAFSLNAGQWEALIALGQGRTR